MVDRLHGGHHNAVLFQGQIAIIPTVAVTVLKHEGIFAGVGRRAVRRGEGGRLVGGSLVTAVGLHAHLVLREARQTGELVARRGGRGRGPVGTRHRLVLHNPAGLVASGRPRDHGGSVADIRDGNAGRRRTSVGDAAHNQFEARIDHRTVGSEVDCQRSRGGSQRRDGERAAVLAEQRARSAGTIVDAQVFPAGLDIASTLDRDGIARNRGLDDQRRIAVRAVVAVNTTIVVDDHRAGGHRVGTRDRQEV